MYELGCVSQSATILEALLELKVEIDHSCGGNGSCGTCRVFVEAGLEKLDLRNEVEAEIAHDRGFSANERLSCQTQVKDQIAVRIPKKLAKG